jgi:glycosyltransferase involved in cell wall biosynthesis
VDFTVIVCTYNRCQSLPSCLAALAGQEGVDGIDWEVLVVDNNSSDDTPKTVERLSRELPIKVRYVPEAQQGLNYARNRGVASSQGTHFTFIDDDIRVSPQWLAALHQAFARTDADAVGGRIHLDPSLKLPPWVVPGSEIAGFLGYQDFGEEPFRMDGRSKYPFGGNMSLHRRVVGRIGLFDPKLGRKGEGRKRGELFKGAETDYFHRLAAAGGARIFYEPRAIVYHRVQPHQLQQRYFLTIHFNAGYQKARYDTREFRRRVLGIPLFLYPQLTRAMAKYLSLLVTRGPNQAFRQLMTVGHFLGTMAGYRNARRETA